MKHSTLGLLPEGSEIHRAVGVTVDPPEFDYRVFKSPIPQMCLTELLASRPAEDVSDILHTLEEYRFAKRSFKLSADSDSVSPFAVEGVSRHGL